MHFVDHDGHFDGFGGTAVRGGIHHGAVGTVTGNAALYGGAIAAMAVEFRTVAFFARRSLNDVAGLGDSAAGGDEVKVGFTRWTGMAAHVYAHPVGQ